MTKVFCFVSGDNFFNETAFLERQFCTAVALTDKGRWIAGAVSQLPDLAVERVANMADAKIKGGGIISDPDYVLVRTDLNNPEVRAALDEAFKRMP